MIDFLKTMGVGTLVLLAIISPMALSIVFFVFVVEPYFPIWCLLGLAGAILYAIYRCGTGARKEFKSNWRT